MFLSRAANRREYDLVSASSAVLAAIDELRRGRMVIVCDADDRENEGDLTLAAQFATPEAIAFMATHGRGLICLSLTTSRCEELQLPPMVETPGGRFGCAFTVSIEAREGVSTGISASDRARTIQAAIAPDTRPGDLVRPGHVFPLRSRPGGVLQRAGHTEAATDLTRLAGLIPAGVICEIVNADGTMARQGDLATFAAEHDLVMVGIDEIAAHRRRTETLIDRVVDTRVPTNFGDFAAIGYREIHTGAEHVAFVLGNVAGARDVLVRVHSACLTGDVFGSHRCDCGDQLESSLDLIQRSGAGVIVYLSQEGRGIGLLNKLRAYRLQEAGFDTVEANLRLGLPVDARDFAAAAQILDDLGVTSVRLISNNPEKRAVLADHGLEVTTQVMVGGSVRAGNHAYLRTKVNRLGHLIDLNAIRPLT